MQEGGNQNLLMEILEKILKYNLLTGAQWLKDIIYLLSLHQKSKEQADYISPSIIHQRNKKWMIL